MTEQKEDLINAFDWAEASAQAELAVLREDADALAAALRRARPTVVNMAHSWEAEARLLQDIDAALAAYEARK